ncbi:pyridoxal phosphate-dependent aminotransferase [Cesiribacter andamanensis]|uniref:Aminotransferase n=1 Tax=Cesiribacter andamanensis AMV16 TaxID=1279009 RepID=M7N2F8_9BACT|nr:pyridoxal phosphate-dependent aminotransferase [Cesiribacter andamanensis]EMR02848.1 Aspartate aminotransferase [Cesiribacter andamanensis AMV16]
MNLLSDRIANLEESATIAMASKAREYKAKGIQIINLSLGEPDFPTPQFIQDAAKEAIDSGLYFAYPPVPGYLDLREALAQKLQEQNGIACTPANIVVSTGAKQSIANLVLCLVNPGDEVILYSPYWVSYKAIVELAGGIPVEIKGSLENNYKATAEQLEAAITPRTKAVMYSSPCNPTGAVFSPDEIRAMAEVLKRHTHVVAIADEIYEYINFTGEQISLGSIPEIADRVATVNGFSKGSAMTGWRVGYMCAPLWLASACNKMQGQFTSATNSIAQRAALAATKGGLQAANEMRNAYLRRRNLVLEGLKEIPGLKTYVPNGAFYIMPDVSSYFGKSYQGSTIRNADELALFLIDHAHVSLVSGGAFGAPESIRISYAAADEDLVEALARIKKALALLS